MPWRHKCMSKVVWLTFFILIITVCLVISFKMKNFTLSDDRASGNRREDENLRAEQKQKQEHLEENEYGEGSICIYCNYCKLCGLCKTDCPCNGTSERPHCSLCKYCPYCDHCKSVCETICIPGGFLDEFTSAIHKALPKINRSTVEQFKRDIKAVKEWVNQYII